MLPEIKEFKVIFAEASEKLDVTYDQPDLIPYGARSSPMFMPCTKAARWWWTSGKQRFKCFAGTRTRGRPEPQAPAKDSLRVSLRMANPSINRTWPGKPGDAGYLKL